MPLVFGVLGRDGRLGRFDLALGFGLGPGLGLGRGGRVLGSGGLVGRRLRVVGLRRLGRRVLDDRVLGILERLLVVLPALLGVGHEIGALLLLIGGEVGPTLLARGEEI